MAQLLLLPDARPLDERLGRSFFREAPRRPGVYLMKDAAGRVLYVGKAKNLKQRLNNYRVANPDRMPARHLRMVREVSRIEFQFCANETAALAREAKLLRGLKPKFNRAGVWQGPPRFLLWRGSSTFLEMTVAETPETGWRRFGPLGGGASHLHRSLARLLWLAANPDRAFAEMPAGWAHGKDMLKTAIDCGGDLEEVNGLLDTFFWESPAALLAWITVCVSGRVHAFERAAITAELETLQNFADKQTQAPTCRQQLALL